MTNWEYHVELMNTEYQRDRHGEIDTSHKMTEIIQPRLDALGRERWELVAFLPALPATSNVMELYQNPWVHYAVFKRPIPESPEQI